MDNPFTAEVPRVGQVVRFLSGKDTIEGMIVQRYWYERRHIATLRLADGTDLTYQDGKWTFGEGPYIELIIVND